MTTAENKTNIILIGMPGCGKTTVGILVSDMLGYKFIDTDQLITLCTGKTPRQIVEENGREGFIKVQDEAVLSIKENECVISTGGGIVHSELAMNYLKSIGSIIYLDTKYDIIEYRMDQTRKLVRANGSLLDLYKQRVPLYTKYADKVVNCSNSAPEDICKSILAEIANV